MKLAICKVAEQEFNDHHARWAGKMTRVKTTHTCTHDMKETEAGSCGSTHRDLVEIDVGLLPVGAVGDVAGSLLELPAETQEILHDHGVHHDDEDERCNEARYAIDDVDDLHHLQVLDPQIAHLVAILALHHPSGDERVGMAGQSEDHQHEDDHFRACHGAHVRSMQRILNRDEPLDGEGDDKPNAERAADRAHVYQRLAPAVLVENSPAEHVVEPYQQQRRQEAEVGDGQRRQVIAGAAQLQVRLHEDHA